MPRLPEQPPVIPRAPDALRDELAILPLVYNDGHAALERNGREDQLGRHDDVQVTAERDTARFDGAQLADHHRVRHRARSIAFPDSPRDRRGLYGQKVIAVATIAHISTRRRREKLAEYLK